MILDRYQLIKGYGNKGIITVGFGSYGQVKLAKDKITGQNVAIKIIHKTSKNQIIFHQELNHPNIIQLLDHYLDQQKNTIYMILEYADDGTLFQKIQNKVLTKKFIKSYFKDICQALAYLHLNQIMHRDIKPQNILLTKKGKAKLCDFGFAALLGPRKTLCGTYQYMAPQMIQNKPYDYKVDIWALGILLFQMIAGQPPFPGTSPQQVLNQMKTTIYFTQNFSNYSDILDHQQINLIKSILRVTSQKRPTVKQILQNVYFQQNNSLSTQSSQDKQLKSKTFCQTHQQYSNQNPENIISNTNHTQYNHTTNMTKHQQNSYPFYAPKTQQQQPTTQMNSHTHTAFYITKTQPLQQQQQQLQQPQQLQQTQQQQSQQQQSQQQQQQTQQQQQQSQQLQQQPPTKIQKPIQKFIQKPIQKYLQKAPQPLPPKQKSSQQSYKPQFIPQKPTSITTYQNHYYPPFNPTTNTVNSIIFGMQGMQLPQPSLSPKLNSSFSILQNVSQRKY